jgi:hypothetical protein
MDYTLLEVINLGDDDALETAFVGHLEDEYSCD